MLGIFKRRLIINLRAHLSNDWVAIVQDTVQSINETPTSSLRGLVPAYLRNDVAAAQIDVAKGGFKMTEPTWREQEKNQIRYLAKPSSLHPGDFVYLNLPPTSAFRKSTAIQVR